MTAVWLVKALPYDPATAAVVEVRWSLGSRAPKFDGKHWPARLMSPPTVTSRLYQGGDLLSGGGTPDVSDLRVIMTEDADDSWKGYEWNGRSVAVYRGEIGDDFGDFATILDTTILAVEWTREVFTVMLDGALGRLTAIAAPSRYAGTGGYEGCANLTGLPKPVVYGKPLGVPQGPSRSRCSRRSRSHGHAPGQLRVRAGNGHVFC